MKGKQIKERVDTHALISILGGRKNFLLCNSIHWIELSETKQAIPLKGTFLVSIPT